MGYPTRIRQPVLHQWDLNRTIHDRYDYPHLRPDDDQLHVEFSILAAVNGVTAFSVFFLIVALLRSKKVRSKPFNLYLFFIATPDFLAAALCLVTCALSAPDSNFFSEWMCGFQSFYLNFAFVSNAWLNGVIVYQIHKMLRYSNVRRKYTPPTHRQVMGHAAAVYAYALLWGILSGFNFDFIPYASHLYYGFACFPMEYDRASSLFFWIVYIPFLLGIPLFYVCYAVYDIVKRSLMPPTGKRRELSLFLLRLCFLYFGVWFPFIILFSVGNFVVISPLVHWIGAVMSHFQGFISAMFCLTNKDIRRSFVLVITCQPASREDEWGEGGSSFQPSSSMGSLQFPSETNSIRSQLFRWSHRRRKSTERISQRDSERSSSDRLASKELVEHPEHRNGSEVPVVEDTTPSQESLARTSPYDEDGDVPQVDRSIIVVREEQEAAPLSAV